jgi:hypothetical protein
VLGTRLATVLPLLAVLGCGGSILIRRDDATYARSIERYQRTRRLVAQSLASDDDQAMFLQAEGLYRYRFALPPRSGGSYVAEMAASIIDLPALESVAGSLDLYGLRMRTADGAVQLWETLLAHSPDTSLRPLALYRLGWAYRNTVASGFPRDSEAAFDELVAKFPGSPLAALAVEAKQVPRKSQSSATAWSIVPGLGQMYVGRYGSGTLRLAIALASAAMVVVPAIVAYRRRDDLSWSADWPLLATSIAGAIILTIDYSRSYQDALRSVIDLNERREADFEDRHPTAP